MSHLCHFFIGVDFPETMIQHRMMHISIVHLELGDQPRWVKLHFTNKKENKRDDKKETMVSTGSRNRPKEKNLNIFGLAS